MVINMAKEIIGEIILFDHIDFQGKHHHIFVQDLGEGDSNLGRSSMNNKTTSVVIKSGNWAFYLAANFESKSGPTLGPGMYKFIQDNGINHNDISSVKLESKAPILKLKEVILFDHAKFQGTHHHVFKEDYDLRNTGMNDLTSSIVIKSGNWAFFKDINCLGQYHPELGRGMYRKINYKISNDAISSLRLKEIKWNEIILFEHPNFQGKHHHIFAQASGEGDPYLPRSGMNDKASSVIVISGEWALYKNANYAAKYDTTLPPGIYKNFNFSGCDIKDDQVSSVNLFK